LRLKDGSVVYKLESVSQAALADYANQMVQIRGIIGSYDQIKQRYHFRMNDNSDALVVGRFPGEMGGTWNLRGRVGSDSDGKLALFEVNKCQGAASCLDAESEPPQGGDDSMKWAKDNPLVVIGALLIVAAILTLAAMWARNQKAERLRLMEEADAKETERQRLERENQDLRHRSMAGNGNKGGTIPSHPPSPSGPGAKPRKATKFTVGSLKVISGPHANQEAPIYVGNTKIGRDETKKTDLLLDKDEGVSGVHGALTVNQDSRGTYAEYRDASQFGSIVDGVRIQNAVRQVHSGSEIIVGGSKLQLTLNEMGLSAASPPSPVPASARPTSEDAPRPHPRKAETVNLEAPIPPKAAPTMASLGAELEVIHGPDKGKQIPITKDALTLGREGTDILFTDASVSRMQATLTHEEGRFVLSDAKSAYGTRVNGEKLAGPRVLVNGDEVAFGVGTVMAFRQIGG
jgi:hypothetical protein